MQASPEKERADGFILVGVFLVNLSLLMLELTLTRIFSITLFYHFAFVAISLALLGVASAGAAVYSFPRLFPKSKIRRRLTLAAAIYSIVVIVAFALHLSMPVAPNVTLQDLLRLIQACIILTLPFFFGGLCIALALTHVTKDAGRVYAADLTGAGLGALLTVPAISLLGGPTTVFLTAVLGAVGALCFGSSLVRFERQSKVWTYGPAALAVVLLGALLVNAQTHTIYITHAKGSPVPDYLYEKWNSFSRVTVVGDQNAAQGMLERATWGLSDRFTGNAPAILEMAIDDLAGTPIVRWNGDPRTIEFLRWDVTAFAYHLRAGGRSLVIGPGGGRDVLTALLMGKEHVTAVEINPAVVGAVQDRFNEFSGGLYRDPQVNVVVDDARSYLEHTQDRYDLIQASMIDTWAATTAGAYVMTEQHLYTTEAFVAYYHRLTDGGMFTASRWYQPSHPAEALRLASLAVDGWKQAGVADPSQHVMMIGKPESNDSASGIVTLLLKRSPFTNEEVARARQVASDLQFQVLYDPLTPNGSEFDQVVRGPDSEAFISGYGLDISATNDDRPFFFNMLRPIDFLSAAGGQNDANLRAVSVLIGLLVAMGVLAVLFIFLPMIWASRRNRDAAAALGAPVSRGTLLYFLLYFSCLGLGFLLIEIPMMQRFILFLGAPVYALAVVLFAILVFSGIGSFLTNRVAEPNLPNRIVTVAGGISVLSVIYVFGLPYLFELLLGLQIEFRIVISILLLAPLGLMMGMPFPMGIRLAGLRAPSLVPWLWSVNGATSVVASILAIAVAMQGGYSRALLVGVAVYAIAMIATALTQRRQDVDKPESPPVPARFGQETTAD